MKVAIVALDLVVVAVVHQAAVELLTGGRSSIFLVQECMYVM